MTDEAPFTSKEYAPGARARGNGAPDEDAGPQCADNQPLLIWYGDTPPVPPKCLVSNTLPEDGVAILGGQFMLGKTFIGADLAAAVTTGGSFAGEPVMRKGAILWFAAEGEKEIEGRARRRREQVQSLRPSAVRAPGRKRSLADRVRRAR